MGDCHFINLKRSNDHSRVSLLIMIDISTIKEYIGSDVSDEKAIEIRDFIYEVVDKALDNYLFSDMVCLDNKNKKYEKNKKEQH